MTEELGWKEGLKEEIEEEELKFDPKDVTKLSEYLFLAEQIGSSKIPLNSIDSIEFNGSHFPPTKPLLTNLVRHFFQKCFLIGSLLIPPKLILSDK